MFRHRRCPKKRASEVTAGRHNPKSTPMISVDSMTGGASGSMLIKSHHDRLRKISSAAQILLKDFSRKYRGSVKQIVWRPLVVESRAVQLARLTIIVCFSNIGGHRIEDGQDLAVFRTLVA